ELAGPPLDRPLDVVLGHRPVARLLDHRAQRRVGVGVTATRARCDLDLARQPCEQLPACSVGCALLVLDRVPLRMAAHVTRPPARGTASRNIWWTRRSPESSGWNV